MHDIIFYFLVALTALSSLSVVLARNPVNGAMSMILALVGTAGLFALLGSYMLAALQILVYAGAVMVLFVFIIMLIDIPATEARKRDWGTLIAAILSVITLGGGLTFLFLAPEFRQVMPEITAAVSDGGGLAFSSQAVAYGSGLMGKYMLLVQVVGFLLLVAMIGVIVISKDLRSGAADGKEPTSPSSN